MTKSPFRYKELKEPSEFLTQCASILKDRGNEYGTHYDLFQRKAKRFSFASGEKITPSTVARMMAEMKLARLDLNNYDEDSLIDCINYLCLYGSCMSMEHVQQDKTSNNKKGKTVADIDFSSILNKSISD